MPKSIQDSTLKFSRLVRSLFLTAPSTHPGKSFGVRVKQIKYIVRGLSTPRLTDQWLTFLLTSALEPISRQHGDLFQKLQRPYLHHKLNISRRFEVLRSHFDFVLTHFPPEMCQEVYSRHGLPLCSMPVEKMQHLELRLCHGAGRVKEGDLGINLFDPGIKRNLCSISFSVAKFQEGGREIFVGGLQGRKHVDREKVVEITRSLYGLRPKALLFFALQELACLWKIDRIRAVSDANHIYRHFLKRKDIAANYDEFWTDCGGKLQADGIFDLPTRFEERDIATIKPKKRKLYRDRYAMQAKIAEQIRNRIAQCMTKETPLVPLSQE